jgi:hypothetical protein
LSSSSSLKRNLDCFVTAVTFNGEREASNTILKVDITERLLKVVLNTIKQTNKHG